MDRPDFEFYRGGDLGKSAGKPQRLGVSESVVRRAARVWRQRGACILV